MSVVLKVLNGHMPIVVVVFFFYADLANLDTPLLIEDHAVRLNKAMLDAICRLMSNCAVWWYETGLNNG